jgi:putative membrane protein
MPADNLEVFKKVIFRLPATRTTAALLALSGIFYSISLFYLFETFFLDLNGYIFIPLFAFGFVLPGVISSELYHYFLPDYPRKWGYFLSLVNQLIVFLFVLLLTISESFYTAWQIIWLALTTLFVTNFFVLVLSVGPGYFKRVAALGLVHPLLLLTAFHFTLGSSLQIGFLAYASNLAVILGTGIVLLIAIYVTEFLVGSNVSNISIFNLVTALLQNRQEQLDLGREVRPDVQTLKIWNRSGEKTFVAPWLHPGPLEGFGGGRITNHLVEKLNSRGKGFFLHVPSCHQMDPSDPRDAEKVYKAMEEPEKQNSASKMIQREYELGSFYGRKIDGKNIVFIEIEEYDDYEAAIFREVIDPEETLVIDLHNQPKGSRLDEMRYGTTDAEKAREHLEEFLQELDDLEKGEYTAGFSTGFETKPLMALVEEVDGQRTLIFGIEGNDASKNLMQLEKEFQEDFDKVVLFTTDTHASIHDLASERQVGKQEVREVVQRAGEDLSPAEIGLTSRRTEKMKFLKGDYFGLIYTINILVRLLPIALVLLYIGLVFWLL